MFVVSSIQRWRWIITMLVNWWVIFPRTTLLGLVFKSLREITQITILFVIFICKGVLISISILEIWRILMLKLLHYHGVKFNHHLFSLRWNFFQKTAVNYASCEDIGEVWWNYLQNKLFSLSFGKNGFVKCRVRWNKLIMTGVVWCSFYIISWLIHIYVVGFLRKKRLASRLWSCKWLILKSDDCFMNAAPKIMK